LASSALSNTGTRSGHAGVEVHSVDTNRRVVLNTKIDVFADTEAKVASLGEVALAELIFLDLQSTLQDFLSFWSTDSDMHSYLLVTTDTERTDGVSGLACRELGLDMLQRTEQDGEHTVDRSLTTQLFQHLCGTSKSITRLSDRDVEDELLDAELLHGILALLSGFSHLGGCWGLSWKAVVKVEGVGEKVVVPLRSGFQISESQSYFGILLLLSECVEPSKLRANQAVS
jgi:hypothetical protein